MSERPDPDQETVDGLPTPAPGHPDSSETVAFGPDARTEEDTQATVAATHAASGRAPTTPAAATHDPATVAYSPAGPGTLADTLPDATVATGPNATIDRGSSGGEDFVLGSAWAEAETLPDGQADDPAAARVMIAGYEILGVLGRGAMGVVYQARQRGLKRVVALKMILAGGHAGEAELSRFRSEAEAVAALQHPNIVQIYEVGDDQGRPFFSLEYVDGDSLAKKIAGTPQPPAEAARLVRLLSEGMQYAHERGIVHRDLKPANILLTRDGVPKVSDFGLVKRLEDEAGQTQSGSILGTPSYMAPEQAEGRIKDVGPLSDVYGLGAILYELMTGRPPFRSSSVLDTLHQVRTEEPIPPSRFQPRVSRDLETVCLKCLQKDPSKRYASAAALGEDLRRFLGGEPILARAVGRAERLWRWSRRNPRVAALGATVALLLVVWAVTSTAFYLKLRAQVAATVAARDLARKNARDARTQESLARANAEAATRNAEAARRNEEAATRNAENALGVANDSITQLARLGEALQGRLWARHDSADDDPEWPRLRTDVLTLLRRTMGQIALSIEKKQVTSFGMVAVNQQLGDMLKTLGQGAEARRQFQQGYERISEIAAQQPDNDQARANLGVMLIRLGETALDLEGDARRARDEFLRAWEFQQEIARRPRSGQYKDSDNRRILSHYSVKLGVAELNLGHPAEARDRFRFALDNRRAWVASDPRSVEARSYLSEAHYRLGVALSHLQDWSEGRDHFEAALAICEGLVRQFPDDTSFKGDLGEVSGAHGEALLRLGKYEQAEAACRKSLQCAEAALARRGGDATLRLLLADAQDRLATVALHDGRTTDAERHFRDSLKVREELSRLEPFNLPWQASWALALAHSGRGDEALKKAGELARLAPGRLPLSLPLARCYAACAGRAPTEGVRGDRVRRMLDVLEGAVGAGYRDRFALQTDPDLSAFREDASFSRLLAGIKTVETLGKR